MKKWIAAGFGVLSFVCGVIVAQETKVAAAPAVAAPLTLTVDDLKKMPRKTLTVANPRTIRRRKCMRACWWRSC